MRKTIAIALAIVASSVGAFFSLVRFSAKIQDGIVVAAAERQLENGKKTMPSSDGLRVIVCGIAPPSPTKLAKSCAVVVAGDRVYVVDAGTGSASNLNAWHFPMRKISAVFLTHFHSDHIGDLGELRMFTWNDGRTAPLPVYGPDGVERVVDGFNTAYAQDDDYRAALVGLPKEAANLVPRPFGLADPADRATHQADRVVLDDGGLTITAFQVDHEPVYPAVGYRFDYKGRSVTFSGDTAPSANLVRHAKNVDVLLHEAQSEEMLDDLVVALRRQGDEHLGRVMSKLGRYHTTPPEAAALANEAHARMLVFDHQGPTPPVNLVTRAIFERGVPSVRSSDAWKLGSEGMVIDLPVGSREIRLSELD